jgi:hypothetical protein
MAKTSCGSVEGLERGLVDAIKAEEILWTNDNLYLTNENIGIILRSKLVIRN